MYKAGKWFDALFEDMPERGQVIWLDWQVRANRPPRAVAPAEERGRLVPFATFVAHAQARRRQRARLRTPA
ncbi:hypothetical protein [Blastochloris viridis]|uniref:Uncharacterized protein n=1 Tax=Blastochloris viridis TaxID=1079 RepID=A0A0H5BP97_BLAVI|nr:hypothetical protein [Blastochloris viridis]ALK11059.1 hypothetical protein BVIR_3303 [Blastochloris viridis]BAR98953.1 hypothetical protein BV133_1360 [Blastochloris viridis]CUU43721.1 hypothetical protein BVIRIDIS_27470 [Blastochloris viridis]